MNCAFVLILTITFIQFQHEKGKSSKEDDEMFVKLASKVIFCFINLMVKKSKIVKFKKLTIENAGARTVSKLGPTV